MYHVWSIHLVLHQVTKFRALRTRNFPVCHNFTLRVRNFAALWSLVQYRQTISECTGKGFLGWYNKKTTGKVGCCTGKGFPVLLPMMWCVTELSTSAKITILQQTIYFGEWSCSKLQLQMWLASSQALGYGCASGAQKNSRLQISVYYTIHYFLLATSRLESHCLWQSSKHSGRSPHCTIGISRLQIGSYFWYWNQTNNIFALQGQKSEISNFQFFHCQLGLSLFRKTPLGSYPIRISKALPQTSW